MPDLLRYSPIHCHRTGAEPPYVSTQFKQEIGINLHNFINRMKIDEATRLLVTADRSIANIASLLAFCSPSHFQSIFKKVAGMNPSKYRDGIHKER